jgi:hypothetical protein
MIRKGQKIANYIERKGIAREDMHRYLFYMLDEEYDKAMEEKVDYEIPDGPEGDKIIAERAKFILDLLADTERGMREGR